MMYDLMKLSLEEKVGQLLIASLDGFTLDSAALRFLSEAHIGNIVHFGNNVRDREQATALNASLHEAITARCGIPPLVCVDHEGGRVLRFAEGVTAFPSAMALGAVNDPSLAERIGRAMGEELRAMGFLLNFAPVLDVNANHQNPVVGVRSFGDDPAAVAALGVAMARGMEAAGLMACAKHFPGHGDTAQDSHFCLPRVDKSLAELEAMDLYPFAAAIRENISAIMTSHILYPQLDSMDGQAPARLGGRDVPATMSRSILGGLLRGRMAFSGLIISDGMHMKAITDEFGIEQGCIEAVKAGCDLLCIGTGGPGYMESQASCYRALLAAVRTGELDIKRVNDAVRRIMAAKAAYSAAPHAAVHWDANAALAQEAAARSITWIAGARPALEGRVLCASAPLTIVRFGVSEGDWRASQFAQVAAESLGGTGVLLEEGADFSALLSKADAVVVGVSRGDGIELAFLEAALRAGKRVAAVLTSLPYVASSLPACCPALCAYGSTPLAVRAACGVLRGDSHR